jgi:tRNA modification GTPase
LNPLDRSSPYTSVKNNFMNDEETIAAISTPFGESGIGIVRVSGPLAEGICRRIFRSKKEDHKFVSHSFHYGEIVDPERGCAIDEVLLVLMKAPKTYTREDVAEIHCHGGYLIVKKVLELVRKEGARLAEPGEFTKRAFLNGRIDLTQAEAVIDLINAKTNAGLEIANQHMKGVLCREVMALKEKLVDELVLIEAHIDFPDEEIDSISQERIEKDLDRMVAEIEGWMSSYEEGKIFRDGVSCAIIGKTNVGKSSLLNVLLNEDRAIVTSVPGTTRDVIEEVLNIKGIPVRLMDTAGLRKTGDFVEMEGVKRTRERAGNAEFILMVLDGNRELDEDDSEIFGEVSGKRKVIVVNKKDLPEKLSMEDIRSIFRFDPIVSVSALSREGIEVLKDAIYSSLIRRNIKLTGESVIVANLRHKVALESARERLLATRRGMEDGISLEFIVFEIRSALETLGEIVGETTSEEVLDRIFGRFCIGK